jgi:hypothetical protein
MADINLERKNPTPWGWIIGAIVLLLVIVGIIALTTTDRDTAPATEPPVATAPEDDARSGALQDLDEFLAEGQERHDVGHEHDYSHEGLHLVADAIDDLAGRVNGNAYRAQTDSIRANADRLRDDPESLRHADYFRNAGDAAANAVGNIRRDHHPDAPDGAPRIRSAAQAVTPQEPLLDQRQEMRAFFQETRNSLYDLDRRQTTRQRGGA